MSSITATVYVPIEESSRELSSRLLIAGELLKHRVTVILGRQPLVVGNLPYVPPGIVLFKGMNAMPAYLTRRSSELGHVSVATDEEGLGLADQRTMSRHMDPEIGSSCSRFFAHGRHHGDAMARYVAGAADKVRVVGNARLDLLREPFLDAFSAEAREHRATHGAYVLVDTNLGAINSRWGGTRDFLQILARVGWLDPEKPEDMTYFNLRVRTEQANAVVIRRTLERLSTMFPNLTFIVRPHPAEREEPWRNAYEDRPNVHVTSQGTHVPWLLGCSLMLHTGCTTGLEAEIMGVPTISLLPSNHEALICADLLSHQANECAGGIDGAVSLAASLLNGEVTAVTERRPHRLRALEDHVGALNGPFAYERIAAEIVELLGSSIGSGASTEWEPIDKDGFVTTRKDYEARVPGLRGAEYSWSKVEIDQAGLEKRLRDLNRASGSTVMPRISEVAEGVFCLQPT